MPRSAVVVAEGFGELAEDERCAGRGEEGSVDEQLAVVSGELVIEALGGVSVADGVGAFAKAPESSRERDGDHARETASSRRSYLTSREVAADELLYSMDVGGVIEVRNGLITRNQVFPSPEEATAAAEQAEL